MLKELRNQITSYFLVVQAQDLEGVEMVGGKEHEAAYPIFRQENAMKNTGLLDHARRQNSKEWDISPKW